MRSVQNDGTILIRSAVAGCFLWVGAVAGGLALGAVAVVQLDEMWRVLVIVVTVSGGTWGFWRLAATRAVFDSGGCTVVGLSGRQVSVPWGEIDRVIAGPFPALRLRDGSALTLWCAIDHGDLQAVVEVVERRGVQRGGDEERDPECQVSSGGVDDEIDRVLRQQHRVKRAALVSVFVGYIVRIYVQGLRP